MLLYYDIFGPNGTSTFRLVFSLVTLSIGRMGGVVEAKPAVGLARWARLTVVLRRLP